MRATCSYLILLGFNRPNSVTWHSSVLFSAPSFYPSCFSLDIITRTLTLRAYFFSISKIKSVHESYNKNKSPEDKKGTKLPKRRICYMCIKQLAK
jgi:hypothetical protein